jgi:uncharacterized membrane protein (DUF106 family)
MDYQERIVSIEERNQRIKERILQLEERKQKLRQAQEQMMNRTSSGTWASFSENYFLVNANSTK